MFFNLCSGSWAFGRSTLSQVVARAKGVERPRSPQRRFASRTGAARCVHAGGDDEAHGRRRDHHDDDHDRSTGASVLPVPEVDRRVALAGPHPHPHPHPRLHVLGVAATVPYRTCWAGWPRRRGVRVRRMLERSITVEASVERAWDHLAEPHRGPRGPGICAASTSPLQAPWPLAPGESSICATGHGRGRS
jgi:hypothetical protein